MANYTNISKFFLLLGILCMNATVSHAVPKITNIKAGETYTIDDLFKAININNPQNTSKFIGVNNKSLETPTTITDSVTIKMELIKNIKKPYFIYKNIKYYLTDPKPIQKSRTAK